MRLSGAYQTANGVQVIVSGARGMSDYQLWRLQGNVGSYADYLNFLAQRVIAYAPGFKGDKGDPGAGGNVAVGRAQLKAAPAANASVGDVWTLSEDGRDGDFKMRAGAPPVADPTEFYFIVVNGNRWWQRVTTQGERVIARELEGRSWAVNRRVDFTNPLTCVPGMDRVPDVQRINGATAVINAANDLEVTAVYSSTDRVLLPTMRYREGILRVYLRRGSRFMVGVSHGNGERFIMWNSGGANFEWGFQKADGTLVPYANAPLPAGGDDETLVIELIRGPWAVDLAYILRCWMETGQYPANPTAAIGIGAGVQEPAINDGVVTLLSFAGNNTRVRQVEIIDSSAAEASAYFVGRWFSRFEGARPVICTTRAGSRFRLRVTGATVLAMRAVNSPKNTQAAVVDLFVDGERGPTIPVNAPQSAVGGIGLLNNLDPARVYHVEGRVRGVHEHDPKYMYGCGLMIESFYTDAGGKVEPWTDQRPKILFIGDSITEGILGRAAPSVPNNSAGDVSWPQLVADNFNLQAVVNGFGGTGLTTPGSGGMPSAATNAFVYMNDRPIDTAAENIKYVVINHGTNDNGQGVAAATFQAAYIAFLAKVMRAFPSAIGIYAMVPFNGAYKAQIQAAVNAMGRPKIKLIDGSAIAGITYTDGVHPNLAGHQTAATGVIAAIGDLYPTYD